MRWRIAAFVSVTLLTGCAWVGFEKPGDSAAPGDAIGGDTAMVGDGSGAGDAALPAGDVAGPLAAPVLTPVVQEIGSDPRAPSIGFSAVAGAADYDFVISSGADCSGDVVSRAGVVTPIYDVTLADNLVLGTTYYWCARAPGSDRTPVPGPARCACRSIAGVSARCRGSAVPASYLRPCPPSLARPPVS